MRLGALPVAHRILREVTAFSLPYPRWQPRVLTRHVGGDAAGGALWEASCSILYPPERAEGCFPRQLVLLAAGGERWASPQRARKRSISGDGDKRKM